MTYQNFIGVDISKDTLDICLIGEGGDESFFQCANNGKDILARFKEIVVGLKKPSVLVCAEHTGHYSSILCNAMEKGGYQFWIENPSQIKLSQGVRRGKDDKKDAERIALYAKRFTDKVVLYKSAGSVYPQLAYMGAERDLLVADRAKYKAQLGDEMPFVNKEAYKNKKKRYEKLILELDLAIAQLEGEMDAIIKADEKLSGQYERITSIDGIGKQVAVQTIVATQGFTKFTEARKFACHAGCAPFHYHSGSSIRSRNKVSHRANKKLKQLYHMAALSAVKMKGEMRDYFVRKVAEGKNKMTVINAVRAKLIARVFAVVNQNRKYDKIYAPTIV